jgi:glycosyltransferase involved in cell wall biosynthesis
MNNLKIGYWPNSKSLEAPGDRRRFIFYLESKGLSYEIYNSSKNYDLVYLSQAADISQIKKIKKTGAKVFYDNIDSYSSEGFSFESFFRGTAKYLMGRNRYPIINYTNFLNNNALPSADAVVCASIEQLNIARNYSSNVFCIPDHTHNEDVSLKIDYTSNKIINIGWEGLGSNVYQLNILKDVLKEYAKTHEFNIHVISDKFSYRYMNKFFKVETQNLLKKISKNIIFHEWESHSYSSILSSCDFAVIPIDLKNKMASGKPENKLINIWKMGLPVITSSTNSYKRVMNDCGLDLYCENKNEWVNKLKMLSDDNDLRKRLAKKAYNYANENYGQDAVISRWDAMFDSFFK